MNSQDLLLLNTIEDLTKQLHEANKTIEVLHNRDRDSRDLAELRPCYSLDGLKAFIDKHWAGWKLLRIDTGETL